MSACVWLWMYTEVIINIVTIVIMSTSTKDHIMQNCCFQVLCSVGVDVKCSQCVNVFEYNDPTVFRMQIMLNRDFRLELAIRDVYNLEQCTCLWWVLFSGSRMGIVSYTTQEIGCFWFGRSIYSLIMGRKNIFVVLTCFQQLINIDIFLLFQGSYYQAVTPVTG